MTRSSTKELFTPFKDPEREFRSSRKLLKTLSLDESRSPEFNLFSDLEEYSEEEVAETMAETMEQYMSKTRADYGSGIARPKIEDKDIFELKGQFLKELRDNTFSGSDHEDANEHIEKVLEIVDLFYIPNITQDQVMLLAFSMSLTGAASRWLRNKPSGSITTWEDLKTKFLSKYCPPARTAKKMEEINNFQQEPYKTLYQAWERFKELLMKFPTRQILDSKGVIPSKTAADAKVAIQEMAEYSKKWHNGTYMTRRPHYSKDCPLNEEGKTLEEAYYTHLVDLSKEGDIEQRLRDSTKGTMQTLHAAIQNQGASIKTLEIQIGKISKISIRHMTPLPPRDQIHLWLHYHVEEYTEEIMHDFEQRLKTIFGSTYRIGDEMGLDVDDALCFQFRGARHSMTWR
ncbi:hypothetical protein Tco_1402149 [Tanacetum coccineum]